MLAVFAALVLIGIKLEMGLIYWAVLFFVVLDL